jgi:hypothetical protein
VNSDYRLLGLDNVAPYSLTSAASLYQIPEPEMLVRDILPVRTITGITSAPGVGKTWTVFELMRSIVTGGKFLSAFAAQKGAALFVGNDASGPDYARQWRKLTYDAWDEHEEYKHAHPEVAHDNPFDNAQFLIQSGFTLDNRDLVLKLIKTINDYRWGKPWFELQQDAEGSTLMHERQNEGFSVVCFDTLSKMTRANQNDNTQMDDVFSTIRLIGEATGCAIVLLHHNSKRNEFNDGEDWRGATAQIGALDNWFQLTPTKHSGIITFTIKKFRGITPAPFSFKLIVEEGATGTARLEYAEDDGESTKTLPDGLTDVILEFMNAEAVRETWLTVKQIVAGISPLMLEVYGGSVENLTKGTRGRLESELRRALPPVEKMGGNKRGSTVHWRAVSRLHEEQNDQG